MKRLFSNWLVFWEGALITHFWGLKIALLYMAAWWLLGFGIKLGYKAGRNARTGGAAR
jgi:hypothetical protein